MTLDDVPVDLVIVPDDLKRAGICISPGGRRWFSSRGFDFRDFIRHGISARTLFETGDAYALRVIQVRLDG